MNAPLKGLAMPGLAPQRLGRKLRRHHSRNHPFRAESGERRPALRTEPRDGRLLQFPGRMRGGLHASPLSRDRVSDVTLSQGGREGRGAWRW